MLHRFLTFIYSVVVVVVLLIRYYRCFSDSHLACIQWRSQEFLSIGQFLSQTILRLGQPWAIEKSIKADVYGREKSKTFNPRGK
jgi:hypothetical protein